MSERAVKPGEHRRVFTIQWPSPSLPERKDGIIVGGSPYASNQLAVHVGRSICIERRSSICIRCYDVDDGLHICDAYRFQQCIIGMEKLTTREQNRARKVKGNALYNLITIAKFVYVKLSALGLHESAAEVVFTFSQKNKIVPYVDDNIASEMLQNEIKAAVSARLI